MKIFTKPENLNGAELIAELAAVGLTVEKIYEYPDNTISFDVEDETKAAAVVKAHNGTTIAPEPTVADKLASVGLNLEDLKAALGI